MCHESMYRCLCVRSMGCWRYLVQASWTYTGYRRNRSAHPHARSKDHCRHWCHWNWSAVSENYGGNIKLPAIGRDGSNLFPLQELNLYIIMIVSSAIRLLRKSDLVLMTSRSMQPVMIQLLKLEELMLLISLYLSNSGKAYVLIPWHRTSYANGNGS